MPVKQIVDDWQAIFIQFLPLLISLVVVAAILWATNFFLKKREDTFGAEAHFRRQLIMLLLWVVGIVIVILDLPISEGMRNQLLALFGLLLTAVITLSSTTVAANAMAGLMLRLVRNIRSGDFVEIEGRFGRVSDRGLFHLEIQTEDRDLIAFPNQYLVQHPVKVIRSSGTFVSATVSLGYDTSYVRVEKALLAAAEATGLSDTFVRVVELGDFSVSYRVAGLLEEVKQLLSARSRLRQYMLDKLHGEGIEIVSPTFMNQRQIAPEKRFIPRREVMVEEKKEEEVAPEEIAFDKAEQAQRLEELRHEHESITRELKDMGEVLEKAEGKAKIGLETAVGEKRHRLAQIELEIEALAGETGKS
jgi:small-conductance mechanosensitive channel